MLDIIQLLSSSTFLIIALVSLIIALLTYLGKGRITFKDFSLEFNKNFEKEVQEIREKLSSTEPLANPAERQYLLLKEYHAQGLAQSKISFWFSLIFASIGFIVIIGAIFMMNETAQLMEQGRTFITLVSGVIIETVSALFFVQSNRARELMTTFFDRLRADRKLEESLRLAESIPDENTKSKLKVLLSLNFCEIKASDEFLLSMLTAKNKISPTTPIPQKDPSKKELSKVEQKAA